MSDRIQRIKELMNQGKYAEAAELMSVEEVIALRGKRAMRERGIYRGYDEFRRMGSKKRWVKIGGYGELGSINWGFDNARVETDKWLNECQKHIGETVLLTGGGSFGKAWLAKLIAVSIGILGGKPTPKVRLENIKPKWSNYGENIFEPWLGSWQISVKPKTK